LSPEHHQRIQEAGVVAADFQSRTLSIGKGFSCCRKASLVCTSLKLVDCSEQVTCTEVAASREVFLGKGDLSKSPAAATGSVGLPDRLR
jgi:hypothetical protein